MCISKSKWLITGTMAWSTHIPLISYVHAFFMSFGYAFLIINPLCKRCSIIKGASSMIKQGLRVKVIWLCCVEHYCHFAFKGQLPGPISSQTNQVQYPKTLTSTIPVVATTQHVHRFHHTCNIELVRSNQLHYSWSGVEKVT